MTASAWQSKPHSAEVRVELYLNGTVFNVAQMGRDFLILRNPADHPPGPAQILTSIDGQETRWPVQLPDGIISGRLKTRITLPRSNGAAE
jgi:hypothetical protein